MTVLKRVAVLMIELNDFFNDGFGWKCRQCYRETSAASNGHARFYNEGEAESKQPQLTEPAMAIWADVARTTLICPRCSVSEIVDKR